MRPFLATTEIVRLPDCPTGRLSLPVVEENEDKSWGTMPGGLALSTC